ncbi:MAG TPA: SMP-30/gluconolactonase/LRE family protein [Alphaproteobacteria bacterium]|nr:SMP-30/gluconolactonase/LRE family protein [Alphaproteobacteria bacterium]
MRNVRCVWPRVTELGEGPIWSSADDALWFVDIKGHQIHRFDPATTGKKSWSAPDEVSFAAPCRDGGHVIGLPGRLALFNPSTGTVEDLLEVEPEWPGNRLNDACVDAKGRLWFGSMDNDESRPSGALYCWDGAASPRLCDRDFVISNGPAVSPDGRTLYHTDTRRRTIFRFEIAADGSVEGKRTFIEIPEDAGWPDGTALDAEGRLWVALWGGWGIRCYSPSGELVETVRLPCAHVTKLAFGGQDLKTAFVTTAWRGLAPDCREAQPLAGSLFAFDVDTPGLPQEALAIEPSRLRHAATPSASGTI